MPPKTIAAAPASAHPTRERRARLRRLAVWASPLLLLLTLVGWGLSSPAGSSPDDDFHIASVWCAYGERGGLCEPGAAPDERLVPAAILQLPCFAFRPTVDASCQNGVAEEASTELSTVTHGNWNGDVYPPLFYATLGVFASDNVAVSVVAMRVFNAVLATALLSLTLLALPRRLRPVLGFSTALSFVPMGLAIIPSTNPSSWALLSAAVVFPTLLALGETSGRQRYLLLALGIVGFVLGAGARGDAALYAALAAALAWFLAARRGLFTSLASLGIIAVAFVAFLSTGQSAAVEGLGDPAAAAPVGISLLVFNLTQLPSLWLGMFTNLGWLDTVISPLAVFGVVFAVIGVLFASLSTLDWRKAIGLATVLGAMALLPLYMLQASQASVGSQVQPRYLLPLFVVLVATALVPTPRAPRFDIRQVWALVLILALAQALALFDQMTRYIAGERVLNLEAGEWWWSGSPLGPTSVLLIASASFALLLAVGAIHYRQLPRTDFTHRVAV